MIAVALIAAAIAACSGSDGPQNQPPPVVGSPDVLPITGSERFGWFQHAPSSDVLRRYRFDLVVDGAPTALSEVRCIANTGTVEYDCTAPLPRLTPGRHVLELMTVDQPSGLASPRSAPLVVSVARSSIEGDAVRATEDVPEMPVTCATGEPSTCFTTTLIASDVGPVRRLLGLPDGRLLVLREDGAVTMLPSGTSEHPDLGRADAGGPLEVADVAAGADFAVNRFLYFATVASAPEGSRTVSIVRVREVADRVGETVTIVADLPLSPGGRPALTVGPDRHLYIALPSAPGSPAGGRPYDGHVLRFAPDGGAAGHARLGSPILAIGSARPASLAWVGGSQLLLGSASGILEPQLAIVPVDLGAPSWPAAALPVGGAAARVMETGVKNASVYSDSERGLAGASLSILGANPPVLYIARLANAARPEVGSVHPVPLGSFTPTTIAVASNGDLIVAATRRVDDSSASLLRLRAVVRVPR